MVEFGKGPILGRKVEFSEVEDPEDFTPKHSGSGDLDLDPGLEDCIASGGIDLCADGPVGRDADVRVVTDASRGLEIFDEAAPISKDLWDKMDPGVTVEPDCRRVVVGVDPGAAGREGTAIGVHLGKAPGLIEKEGRLEGLRFVGAKSGVGTLELPNPTRFPEAEDTGGGFVKVWFAQDAGQLPVLVARRGSAAADLLSRILERGWRRGGFHLASDEEFDSLLGCEDVVCLPAAAGEPELPQVMPGPPSTAKSKPLEVTIGRIVRYWLTDWDVSEIINRRTRANHILGQNTVMGTTPCVGQVLPMIVTSVFDDPTRGFVPVVNGKVFLDGDDNYWVEGIPEGNGPGEWHWPERS